MGRIDQSGALDAADRYRRWRDCQQQNRSDFVDAHMRDRRRDLVPIDERVYFESIVDGSDMLPMRYLALGQLAARAVGRLFLPADGNHGDGFATGFLVAPNLLLTNHHVLPDVEWARAATLTMDAEDGLDGLPLTPRIFQLDPDRLYFADKDLDFCFVAVRPRSRDGSPLAPFGYLRLFATPGKIVRDEYATIVQHPHGRQKHIAARNNRINVYVYDDDLDDDKERAENNFLYYSTDTLGGSSGSPVFSDQWFVVALHRRGVPKTKTVGGRRVILRKNKRPAAADDPPDVVAYESNEGVRVSRILRRLQDVAAGGDARAQAAAEAHRRVSEVAEAMAAGPVATATATFSVLQPVPAAVGGGADFIGSDFVGTGFAGTFEIVRRAPSTFPEALGYNPRFLAGHALPMPEPTASLRRELAPRRDDASKFLLPFRHFTTAMHARRRLPIFAAINIAGGKKPERLPPRRPSWSYDPRIDAEHQPDDSIFSSTLQRGHMCARDYAVWGDDDDERSQADVHSFTLTNVCPQIAQFNGRHEWYDLEREVMRNATAEDRRLTIFVGPVLRADDPDYDSLRSRRSRAARGTRIRIPLQFWKIVAWVERGALRHKAFLLDQSDELDAAGPLEIDIGTPVGVREVSIDAIARKTDLVFEGLNG